MPSTRGIDKAVASRTINAKTALPLALMLLLFLMLVVITVDCDDGDGLPCDPMVVVD